MNKFKLSNLSFSLIVISLINSTILGIIIPFMINNAKTSVFMSLVYGYFIGIFILFLFLKIFNFLPSKNIFEKISSVCSSFVSKILYFIIGILVFGMAILIFWRLTTFISNEFLIDTPTILIAILLILPIIYLLMFDFDVSSRIASFNVFTGFLMIVFNVLALRSNFNMENFKPILNNDFVHLSKSSIIFALCYFAPLFLTLVIPKDCIIDNKKTSKYLFVSYSVSFFVISSIIFTVLAVMGISVSSLYTYPSYVVLKAINVLNFIENIENVSIIVLLLFMSYTVSFCFLYLKKLIFYSFRTSEKNSVIYSICFLVIPTLSFIMFSLPFEGFLNMVDMAYVIAGIYFLLILVSLFILFIGKRKKVNY